MPADALVTYGASEPAASEDISPVPLNRILIAAAHHDSTCGRVRWLEIEEQG